MTCEGRAHEVRMVGLGGSKTPPGDFTLVTQ